MYLEIYVWKTPIENLPPSSVNNLQGNFVSIQRFYIYGGAPYKLLGLS